VDERATALAELGARCAGPDVDLLTLDVFDTVLVRRVSRPIDAFLVLGHRLEPLDLLPHGVTPAAFARLRRLAEARARERAVAEGRSVEISLEDVYAEIADVTPEVRSRLADAELRVERSLCFVDPAIVEVADAARAHGCTVALVSDTYFSASQLDYLVGGRLDATAVFASSEHGVGKGQGLFDIVLDRLDIEAGRAVHAGDNEHADVAPAERIGIRAFLLPRVSGALTDRMVDEGLGLDSPQHPAVAPPRFDVDAGDHGLAGLRERAVSAASVGDDALAPYRVIGAGVLGPVFAGFAEWVVREAVALGHGRVYCLMREGALLAPLVDTVAEALGADVRAAPLWVSRHVAVRAAIGGPDEIDEALLRSFLVRRRVPTARALAASLGVPVRRIAGRGESDVPLDDVMLANRVVARILADGRARRAIATAAAEERERLARYLGTALHPDDREVLVVDLGWNATIQVGLERALARMGHPRPVVGRYLATTREVVGPALAGVRTRGFLVDAGVPEGDGVAIVRNPEVLEMVTLPAQGSVVGYSASGEPQCTARPAPAAQLAQEAAVRDGISTFATTFLRSRALHPELGLAGAAPALRAILRRFLARPTVGEFAAFAGWLHEDNYGSEAAAALGAVDPALDLDYVSADDLYRLPQHWWWWPAGIVAGRAPDLAAGADAILDGRPPGAVGEDHRAGWRVALDVESSLVAGEHLSTEAITFNRSGRALVRHVSVVHAPTALRWRVPADREVRVDRIRTVFSTRGRPDTVVDVQLPDDAWTSETDDPTGVRTLTFASSRLPDGHVYRTESVCYLSRGPGADRA